MMGSSKKIIKKVKKLKKYEDTLNCICEERVFSLGVYDDTYFIRENCDDYFSTELTSQMCKDLSKVFKILGKRIEKEELMKVEIIKSEEIKVE